MSHCWCKCEAGVGQCGPKVPKLKSLFAAHKQSDEASLRRGDRQAELQVIWEELGEDKQVRMEDLKHAVATSVDKLYDKALEEAVRKRAALESSVTTSEERLKDKLGPDARTVIAPVALPLQQRLEHNLNRLHELDSQNMGSFGWVGGLLLVADLRKRLIALRNTLRLPAIDANASVDELVQSLSGGTHGRELWRSPSPSPLVPKSKGEQKPMYQRLENLYNTLCNMERTWAENFAHKAQTPLDSDESELDSEATSGDELYNGPNMLDETSAEKAALAKLHEMGQMRDEKRRKRERHRRSSDSFGSGGSRRRNAQSHMEPRSPFLGIDPEPNKPRRSIKKLPRFPTDEGIATPSGKTGARGMELLSEKLLKKLDSLAQQANFHTQDSYTEEDEEDRNRGMEEEEELDGALSPRSRSMAGSILQPFSRPISHSGSSSSLYKAGQPAQSPRHALDITSSPPESPPFKFSPGMAPSNTKSDPPTDQSKKVHYINVGTAPFLFPPLALLMQAGTMALAPSLPPAQRHKGAGGQYKRPSSGLLDVFDAAFEQPQVMQRARPAEETMGPVTLAALSGNPRLSSESNREPTGSSSKDSPDPWSALRMRSLEQAQENPDASTTGPGNPVPKLYKELSFKDQTFSPLAPPPAEPRAHASISNDKPPPPPPPLPGGPPGAPRPPPPPPPGLGGKSIANMLRAQNKSRLKRSSKMGHLYRGLKTRLDKASAGHAVEGGVLDELEGSAAVRLPPGAGGREGNMAEALAEITKKSAYFKQIEEDVQKHAAAVWEAKAALLAFQTNNMDDLMAFHRKIESLLENLTDESQVLSRFEGFPSKKMETVRMAAGLYSRLATLERDLTAWTLDGSTAEEIARISKYFDKMKKEVESVERTREDDAQRFNQHKIAFNFAVVTRVKEAAVALSARILQKALEESMQVRFSVDIVDGVIPASDIPRVKGSLQATWLAFQFSFRIYNFAGGQDEDADRLAMAIATEMEAYPSYVWA